MPRTAVALAFTAALLAALPGHAQLPGLVLPELSPAASRQQVVGLTNVRVDWHRPAVKGRTIWGGLVPWGEVWRVGANENTTLTVDGPVTFGGQPLAAGTYGLFLLPVADGPWTVILSREHRAWGSYSYDQAEDVLRLAVTPREAPLEERLDLRFDGLTDRAVTLSLRWEKQELPVEIAVAFPESILASFREQLRGRPRFGWYGWNQAASWSLQNGGDLVEAARWADKSLELQRTFANLRTRAAIAEKLGDTASAAALREEALTIGSETDLARLGKQLLADGKGDDAIAVLRRNADAHPTSAATYEALAEAYAARGDARQAKVAYQRALKFTKDEASKVRLQEAIAKLAKP
jgi:tetratricopeptide (TPR) repeat protein